MDELKRTAVIAKSKPKSIKNKSVRIKRKNEIMQTATVCSHKNYSAVAETEHAASRKESCSGTRMKKTPEQSPSSRFYYVL